MIQQFVLKATGVYSLGPPSAGDLVACTVFQVIGAGWTGSALVKVRVFGPTLGTTSGIPNAALKTVPYFNVATGATVAAGAAITGDGIYAVSAPGLDVVLDYTHSAGSVEIDVNTAEGPLALATAAFVGDGTNGLYTQFKARPATVTVVAVAATATSIVAANTARSFLTITNADASTAMYLGTSSGVTTSNGYKLGAGQQVVLSATNNAWFGISATGTINADVIEAS